jgi:hypothetical protein
MIILGETEVLKKSRALGSYFNINPAAIALGSTPDLLSDRSVNSCLNHGTM